MNRFIKIAEEGKYTLWVYKPSLFAPLYGKFFPISFTRRIRLMLEYLSEGQYKVYYLKVNQTIVGYNVFAIGGRRLKCSTRNDLVSGPLFISPEYRRLGYATILKKMIIKYCCSGYNYIYSWIDKNNIASIKSSENVGFDMNFGELVIKGKMRKLRQVERGQGTNIIVRYKL